MLYCSLLSPKEAFIPVSEGQKKLRTFFLNQHIQTIVLIDFIALTLFNWQSLLTGRRAGSLWEGSAQLEELWHVLHLQGLQQEGGHGHLGTNDHAWSRQGKNFQMKESYYAVMWIRIVLYADPDQQNFINADPGQDTGQ